MHAVVAEGLRDCGNEVLVVWFGEGLAEVVGSGDTLFSSLSVGVVLLINPWCEGEGLRSND